MPKRPTDEIDEEDDLPQQDEEDEDRDAYAVLDDEDDPSPGDRRRDPLRKPHAD